ncbi:S-layer protein [uncultured archaeon]|nr:S-layer protein [uncultured archaeon]
MVINRYSIVIAFVLMMGIVLPVTAAVPDVSITAPSSNDTSINGSFTFIANVISTDENLNSVYFKIFNSTDTVSSSENLISTPFNTSGYDFNYTVNTQTLGGDGNYSLEVTATNNGTSPNSSTANRTFIVNNNISITPPSNVSNLTSTAGMDFINWTWVDPIDANFKKVNIYIDGIFKIFVNKGIQYYNQTFSPNSTHAIAIYSVDNTGNVNTTNPSNNTNTTLPNTPTGQVTLTFSNLQISFSNVTTAGNTSVSTSSTPPADPGSLFTAIGFYYTITTTAISSENVTIGLTYTGLIPAGGYSASDVHLYRYDSSWTDITTTRDSTKVYGNVTGFSTFVLGVQPKPAIIKDYPLDTNVVTTGSQSVTFQAHSDQIANINWSIDNGSPFNNGSMAAGQISNYTPAPSIGPHNVSVTATNTTTGMSNTTYWNWTVQPKTFFQGNRVWDASRPDLFSKTYTWNPMSFSGFYYNIDKDVGNESITITLNSYTDRNIKAGNIVYGTTPEEVGFGYSGFGSYQVIGFMADKYFAGYIANTTITNARPSTTFTGKSALAQGQLHKVLIDDDTQRTVSIGSTLTLQDGYVLKATDIDTTARTMLITLLKDGSEVDTTPLSAGETYVYTKRIGAVQDLPIIMVRFDNVFSGREVQAAFLKGLFQISETPTMIKTGTQFGSMEVTGVGGNGIQMDNKNAISLTEGSTQDLMGDMKIVVADNSSVIRYALSVEKTGDFEVRSSVYRDTDGTNAITEWNPYNFGMNIGKTSIGFYYNLDDGIGNESLKINPSSSLNVGGRTISDQGLVYTTTPQDVGFGYTNFGSYQAIGFMADKYFAGYTAGTTVNAKPSTSFSDKSALAQGQLHKVLIDDDAQRTISVGGTLTLQEGYVLKATDIDTTARIMLISLLKDGSEVDTTPLSAGETYVYTKKIGAVRDLPIIMVRFDNVFSGREVQAAFLKGVFQISETPTILKTGDHFGKMEVTGVSKDAIEMKNDGSISLNQNSEDTLMGNVKLKVADSSSNLRFYFAVDVTPEMVANQLVIDAPSKITAGDVAIVKVTAGGDGVDGASVVLGSTDMGQTDSTGAVNYTLPKTLKGMYNITATKLGYQSATKSIEILQYVEYRLSMDAPAKANQFETIPIKITYNGTAIPGATVKFDNTTIGTTDSSGVLNYKFDTSGTHTLTASKSGYIAVAREIEVRAPYSEYRALDINITPNSTFTNREVLIRSNITNAGTKGDTLPVELKVNNSVVDNRTITLAPGEKQEINFTLKEAKPGNYTVEILGQKGILEVKEAPLSYLLIGGIATGLGAIIIYVLTAKGKITLGDLKSKLNVDAVKSLLPKSGKKGL